MTKEALLRIVKNKGVNLERWEKVHAYASVSRENGHKPKEGDEVRHIYVVFSRSGNTLSPFYEIMPDAIISRGESIEDYTTEHFTKISNILNL